MSVQLGQVATVAAIATALSSKKAGAAAAALLASGLVKIEKADAIKIPSGDTNGVKKFVPKIENLNRAARKRDKCIDLQLKLNLMALNFKLPSISLALRLPELPTWNLDFLKKLLSAEIKCVLEAMALIAAIQALMKSTGGGGASTASASVYDQANTAANTVVSTDTKTKLGSRTVTFKNPNL
jgi:hypothetical protein